MLQPWNTFAWQKARALCPAALRGLGSFQGSALGVLKHSSSVFKRNRRCQNRIEWWSLSPLQCATRLYQPDKQHSGHIMW